MTEREEAIRLIERFLEGRIGLILEPLEANECAEIVVEELLSFIYDLPLTEEYIKSVKKYEEVQRLLKSKDLC